MIYLASNSPRRAELLTQVGVDFVTLPVHIDEAQKPGETAPDYVRRIAAGKAQAGSDLIAQSSPEGLVLGADTIICIDGKIVGKPADQLHCQAILGELSGRQHQVLSAICLQQGDKMEQRLSTSRVSFRQLDAVEIATYCASEEPLDKAGAYAIQGRAAVFIDHLEGSYSSVMGLPLYETAELLKLFGINCIAHNR